jgi:hypothetical protein
MVMGIPAGGTVIPCEREGFRVPDVRNAIPLSDLMEKRATLLCI